MSGPDVQPGRVVCLVEGAVVLATVKDAARRSATAFGRPWPPLCASARARRRSGRRDGRAWSNNRMTVWIAALCLAGPW